MNWAIGHGSNGGRLARRCGYCRSSSRTSSLLQSQKAARSSRSSSGVRRSEENVVRAGVSVVGSATTDDRFFLADFISVILPLGGSNNPVRLQLRGGRVLARRPTGLASAKATPDPGPPRPEPCQHLLVLLGGQHSLRALSHSLPSKDN